MGSLSKKKNRIIFNLLFLMFGLFIASAAFAQTQITISTSVPGTYPITTGTGGPGGFIANFYQFALMIGGVLAFGVIGYGGIKYMASAGNPSAQSDAKEWIEAALLGLLLLVGAYFILSVINPQLLNLNLPSLTSVNLTSISVPGGGTGPGSSSGGKCQAPTTGACTAANLQQNSCLGSNAALFAGICGNESGGNAAAKSGSDYCTGPNGEKESVSIGLFQINLTNSWKQTVDGQNCGNAFKGQAISCSGKGPCTTGHNGTGQQCQVTNIGLYNDCVKAAQVAANNINVACQLSNNGTSLGPWKADAASCGF